MNSKPPPSDPLVTVVIPTRNRYPMLLDTINSVLRQRMDRWHIIIVDNDSNDGTEKGIPALNDQRIEYIRQPNQGPSGGRNTGIQKARTPWIAFLDSDDLWKPEFLETMMEAAARQPEVGLFSAQAELISLESDGSSRILGVTPASDPRLPLSERLLRQGNFFATSTVMVKTEALQAVEGFDPALARSEDTDLWLRLALRYPGVHLPQALAAIRIHPEHTQLPEDRLDKLERRIYICSKALASFPEGNPEIKRLLQRRLRVSWRERARILTERKQWKEAAEARLRQWVLRPIDPRPLLRWACCRLRNSSNSSSSRDGQPLQG